ncbi:MAG: RNA methyltransferase [Bacteroidetes bacterium]|nr:RNA methyltransferase [Bacteroidota bacterium]MBU1578800.1 RNA methyltransferase [Bacteroidota bacterium]MBU2466387.1 RNA methyltransferase [Bacteroidota bacterium]MBU2558146.1 RNA methyltransferase [Bacteroidota bacterium]
MITSKTNPQVKNLIHLQKASERKRQQLFVAEGRREIERALKNNFQLEKLYACAEICGDISALQAGEIVWVSAEVFEKLAYRGNSDGLVALFKPVVNSLESLSLKKNPLLIILEAVEKPGNLGAVLRTADAAAADAVIVCDPKTDIYNPNTIRSSLGCVFSVPVVVCSSDKAIKWLKEKEIKIFATYLEAAANYLDADYRKASAIVMGTEASGLSAQWIKAADQNLIIPMRGIADSLNVSVSTAIVVFEALRQRR